MGRSLGSEIPREVRFNAIAKQNGSRAFPRREANGRPINDLTLRIIEHLRSSGCGHQVGMTAELRERHVMRSSQHMMQSKPPAPCKRNFLTDIFHRLREPKRVVGAPICGSGDRDRLNETLRSAAPQLAKRFLKRGAPVQI